jgi:hypothetical protein
MNKSFKDRLAALEALEMRAELDREPLTSAQRYILYNQIELGNVTMDARGLLVRGWKIGAADDTAALDTALARCNAARAALRPRLTTLEAVDLWLRGLEDPDIFDASELCFWVFFGLLHKPRVDDWPANREQVRFSGSVLQLGSALPSHGGLRGWWGRIIERAAPIIQEHGYAFFPLRSDDIRAALDLIDSGEMTYQPLGPQSQRSHSSIIKIPYGSAHYELRTRVAWAFDQYMEQIGGEPIQSADELRADLVAALEQYTHDEFEETA